MPPAEDPDGDAFTISVIESPIVMEFVQFDQNGAVLLINDLSSEDVQVGSFKITI